MFKVFYDCQAMREVVEVALCSFFSSQWVASRVLLLASCLSPLAANRKKQSTRVFKINCYDGFC